jgi:hypothetical protein
MFNEMERWLGGLGPDEAKQTIAALTKVRDTAVTCYLESEISYYLTSM